MQRLFKDINFHKRKSDAFEQFPGCDVLFERCGLYAVKLQPVEGLSLEEGPDSGKPSLARTGRS